MAYNNFNNRSNTQQTTTRGNYAAKSGAGKSTDRIIVGGVYPHTTKDGTTNKLLFKGKVLSEVVIPAGYELKLFDNAGKKSKNGKDLPPVQIVAQPAQARRS